MRLCKKGNIPGVTPAHLCSSHPQYFSFILCRCLISDSVLLLLPCQLPPAAFYCLFCVSRDIFINSESSSLPPGLSCLLLHPRRPSLPFGPVSDRHCLVCFTSLTLSPRVWTTTTTFRLLHHHHQDHRTTPQAWSPVQWADLILASASGG